MSDQIAAKEEGSKMTEKHRGMWFAGTVLLAIAVSMAPFGGAYGSDKKEIIVGAINSMTGPNNMTGAEQKWSYEQAVADINKKGGVFVKDLGKKLPIKLVFADDKSLPDEAAAGMERLIR